MNKYFNIVIAMIVLSMLAAGVDALLEVEPPSAILKIDRNEQTSGIGSYCWFEQGKGLCADMIGIPTAQEPLLAGSPFTAHLRLPLNVPPEELQLNVIQVTDNDELETGTRGWRWWRFQQGKRFTLPLERESDINLSLDPGLYVLNIDARWKENGSVSYGFLLKVKDSSAVTLTVDKSSSANYTNIQDAINNASNGDTILVNSGTYYENVNVTKRLILKGVDTGRGKPVVVSNASGNSSDITVITLSAGNSTLEGFVAVNASSGTGIYVSSNKNIIRNNTVLSNNNGISLGSSNNTLSGNTVLNNNQSGISVYSSNNNITANNASYNFNGIHLSTSNAHNNTLINNNVSNNNVGVSLFDSRNNMLNGNTASNNNNYGIYLSDSSNNTIYNNFFNNSYNVFNINYDSVNTWNITKTNGTNIIGGPYIGGNVWANPDGKGASQTCKDGDSDGICDSFYTIKHANPERSDIDYLPLAYAYKAQKSAGFEVVLAITVLLAIYVFGRRPRKNCSYSLSEKSRIGT